MPINFFKYIVCPDDANVTKWMPSDDLKDIVEGYYVFQAQPFNGRQLFFNDGYPVIAFMQTENEKTKILADGQVKWVGSSWVCGGLLKNIYCETPTAFNNVLVVRFYPGTFFKLFTISDNCFERTQIYDLLEIAGDSFEALNAAYYGSSSFEERIEIINGFLSEKTGLHDYPKVLTDILHYIDRQNVLTVKELLEGCAYPLNYKWLERNFKKHLGISPKNYLLIRRFLNAYLDMLSCTSKELLQIAVDNGYYDDNHLIKDFRKFSGLSPKMYFQKHKRAVWSGIGTE